MKCFASVLVWSSLFYSTPCLSAAEVGFAADRPNVLWITAEDMSPTLGCYGDQYATTPHIDRLAERSTRYTHAFATAPVCSPSRSCLITGCYATSLGTHQMRSAFRVPEFIRGFPTYLREAGYYTTNNYKTDYNTSSADRIIGESWDASSTTAHWRNRPTVDGKQPPFFSVFNIMTSHQSRSMVWSQDRFRKEVQARLSLSERHDPRDAPLPSYYPDSLVTRRIVARYYDCVTAMDAHVGEILAQLEADGLADDTIVFFFSDHGSGMPRHKRLLHDSGMHVPLLVHFPMKWAHLAPSTHGGTTDRLVSFVDFAPTVLKLIGVDRPDYMQGDAFIGEGTESTERQYVFGHRDRIDEVIDLSRSVRDNRYLLISNYFPQRSWNQFSAYSDLSEIRHELYCLAENGTGTPAQNHYVGEVKPRLELYDCVADPENIVNLISNEGDATLAEHQEKLDELQRELVRHGRDTKDLGFLAESDAQQLFTATTPWEAARDARFAAQVLSAEETGSSALTSKRASARYWAAIRAATGQLEAKAQGALTRLLEDDSSAVRIEAANALARHGQQAVALPVLVRELKSEDLTSVLHATRTIELLGDSARDAAPAMQEVAACVKKWNAEDTPAVFNQTGAKDLAMFCGFSANGFLQRLQAGPWLDLLRRDQQRAWQNASDGVTFEPGSDEVTMLSNGENLWIVHNRKWQDFELVAEVKMPDDEYNAGIGFRCQKQNGSKPKGYQCEISEEKSGSLYAIASGGWVWPKGKQQEEQFNEQVGDAFRHGRWNHFRIRCEGERIRIWVNGILSTDVEDARHRVGRIALQHHGKGGPHHYRNVRVRELAAMDEATRPAGK